LPSGLPFVDPYPDDGPDDSPFYFEAGENPADYVHQVFPGADLLFGDFPAQVHTETSAYNGYFRANLFLVSWNDIDPYHLIIHDGIVWGFDSVCTVPAPGALVAGAGLGVVAVRRGRRRTV
jgi:hypothetical protein